MMPCCVRFEMMGVTSLPIIPFALLPMLFSPDFCSSLKRDISLLVYSYPPSTSILGRYFVLTAFLVFLATSCFSLDMLSCLLLRIAMALQLSRLSSCCAEADDATHRNNNMLDNLTIYLNVKLLEPIMFPSANMLT